MCGLGAPRHTSAKSLMGSAVPAQLLCLQHLGFLRLVAAMWPQLLVCPVDALSLRTAPPPAPGCSFPPWDLPGPGAKPVDADFKERPVSFSSLAVSRQHPLLPREKGDKFKVR